MRLADPTLPPDAETIELLMRRSDAISAASAAGQAEATSEASAAYNQ
jgi:hypothetical protein